MKSQAAVATIVLVLAGAGPSSDPSGAPEIGRQESRPAEIPDDAEADFRHWLKRIEARDGAAFALHVRTEHRWVPASAGDAPTIRGEIPFEDGTFRARGEWLFRGNAFAFRETSSRGEHPPRVCHGIWDGADLRVHEHSPDDPPGILRRLAWTQDVLVRDRRVDPNYTSCSPLDDALRFHGQKWSVVFPRVPRRRILGRATHIGRPCLVVLFDNAPPTNDDRFVNPHVAWIDVDETFLVLRLDSRVRESRETTPDGLTLGINDAGQVQWPPGWRTYTRFAVSDVQRLGEDLWVPREQGRLGVPVVRDGVTVAGEATLSRIEPLTKEVVGSSAPDLFELRLPREYTIIDQVNGTSVRHVSGDGGGEQVPVGVARFREIVAALAREEGMEVTLTEAESLDSLTCGARAMAVLAALHGSRAPVEAVRSHLTDQERAGGVLSLARLAELASGFGLASRVVRADRTALPLFPGTFVAVLRPREAGDRVGHFVVASVNGDRVRLTSYPDLPQICALDEFCNQWTGDALLVARSDTAFASIDAALDRRGSSVAAWIGGALILSGVAIGVVLWRRRAP